MGCDIHIHTEVRKCKYWQHATGNFSEGSAPFDWRSYNLYGFLAGVRNYSAVEPICEPKGFPDDASPETNASYEYWDCDAHSATWLTLEELLAVDYEAIIEDRRVTRNGNGGCTCEPGEGEPMPLREFLGPFFMRDLATLQEMGAPEDVRVVFWFDN
jgi:hypothetical protein